MKLDATKNKNLGIRHYIVGVTAKQLSGELLCGHCAFAKICAQGEIRVMKISELLPPSLIKLDLEAETREELFSEMVQLFVANGSIKDPAAAVRVLEEREAKMSTGISSGLGLPHGKLPEAKSTLLALGISREGIEYDSLDGEPVYVVITIFAEVDNPGQHILVLAELSRLFALPNFMEKIRSADSREEVLAIISEEE